MRVKGDKHFIFSFFIMNKNQEIIINSNNLFYVYTSQLWDYTNIYLSLIDKMNEWNTLMYDAIIWHLRRQLNIKQSVLVSAIKRFMKEKLLICHQRHIFINPYIVSYRRWWDYRKLCYNYDYLFREKEKSSWHHNNNDHNDSDDE